MSEWKKVRLGEIANYVNEKIDIKAFDTSLYISTDSMLKDKGGIGTPESIPESGKVTKYQHNDILVSNIRPYFKKIWFSNREGGCSNDVLVFRANDNIDSTFLYYVLSDDSFFDHIMSSANGTKMPRGNRKLIPSFEINLPPLSTQHRIATILSRYDSLIENYQKQIKLLEEAAQRLYKEWFVDLRFPGHENTKIVDGVPEGWEKKKVKEVCDTTSGGTPSRSKTEFYTGDILWVKTKELNDDFIFDTEEKITEDAIRNSSAKMVPSGSILMAMYGATIGKLGIATKELSCNQACCVFLLPEDSTLRLYLYNWLLNSRTLLISMGKGAAQPNLSQDMIKNLEVVVPSSCLLAKFDSKVKPLYRIMSYHSSQLRLLTEARDRLLPKLMSGEIEI